MKRLFTLCVGALVAGTIATAHADNPSVTAPQVKDPTRVLLVGNSYLYYGDSLHNHLRRIVQHADADLGRRLQYKSATIGGAWLDHHDIDWLTRPGQIGVKQPFELVLLNENSAAPLSAKGQDRFMAAARAAAKVVRERGGQVALYMAPAYVPPHKQADPENIRKIAAAYVAAGNALNALVIPVALAFDEAYRRHPELKLHKDYDGSHPSMAGTYLAAATVFASLYARSPVGNGFDAFGEVDAATIRKLQAVADEVVKQFFGR